MSDTLQISTLKIMTRIGVHAWEQRIMQPLLIDICIPMDMKACHDALENTIDYDQLCQRVTTFVETNTFRLIETVAENVVRLIKQDFNVGELSVSVSKPNAIKNAGNVSVTVYR